MCSFQRQVFIELKVLLHVKAAIEILNAHVVDIEVVASRNRSHTIEHILSGSRKGYRVYDHIRVGQYVVYRPRYFVRDLAGALEGYVASKSDGNIREVMVPCPADAHSIHFENAVYFGNRANDICPHSFGRRIQ